MRKFILIASMVLVSATAHAGPGRGLTLASSEEPAAIEQPKAVDQPKATEAPKAAEAPKATEAPEDHRDPGLCRAAGSHRYDYAGSAEGRPVQTRHRESRAGSEGRQAQAPA